MSSQEQPEENPPADDQQPDEAEAPAEQAAEAGSDELAERRPETPDGSAGDEPEGGEDAPPTDEERIEQITERIEKARATAEEAGILEDTDEEEYVESGATEEEDDQTIAPPG